MKIDRHIIASIFLILFICIYLADLHIVSHDANDADCELCLLTSENLDDTFTSANVICLPDLVHVPVDHICTEYVSRFMDVLATHSFLNKAPPTGMCA